MEISPNALKHIKRLMNRRAAAGSAGLRLRLKGQTVHIKWDCGGPRENDLVVLKQGISMFLDFRTYLLLSDYVLDFTGHVKTSRRFTLRPGANGEKPVRLEKTNHEKHMRG